MIIDNCSLTKNIEINRRETIIRKSFSSINVVLAQIGKVLHISINLVNIISMII